jgi:RimJ/RimL family protein N-acetyltransferase
VIDTARLRLRPPTVGDAPEIFARYAQDPEVTRYLVFVPHRAVTETVAFLRTCEDAWRDDLGWSWVIEARDDGRLLGMIDLRRDGSRREIGYVLARPEWGRGYMTEALRAVLAAAFADPTVWRVWAGADIENLASQRVMEKAGMTREGVFRRFGRHPNRSPDPRDAVIYAKVRGASA